MRIAGFVEYVRLPFVGSDRLFAIWVRALVVEPVGGSLPQRLAFLVHQVFGRKSASLDRTSTFAVRFLICNDLAQDVKTLLNLVLQLLRALCRCVDASSPILQPLLLESNVLHVACYAFSERSRSF